jgi:hypothetical protein
MCVKGNGVVCGKVAVNGVCAYHERVVLKRQQKEREKQTQEDHYVAFREVLRTHSLVMDLGDVYEFLLNEEEKGVITRRHRAALVNAFVEARTQARIAMLNKPELQKFTEDTQNVHRKVVTDNTNDQTKKLLEVTVPSEQNTLAEIRTLFPKSRKVMTDVEHWYAVTMCRKEADCLYKRTLDGLWTLIKASPHKDELSKRLVEEIAESVGQCCEGHLSRLCNVLVGFDEAFTTVVSKGEILQQKMADIAELKLTSRAKKMRARKILRELAIPTDQHADWLEAF